MLFRSDRRGRPLGATTAAEEERAVRFAEELVGAASLEAASEEELRLQSYP